MPVKNDINAELPYIKQLTFQQITHMSGIIFLENYCTLIIRLKIITMQNISTTEADVIKINQVDSSKMKCFAETPWKTGQDKPLKRIGAFDLFNLFTADIIRSKKVFTR